jgi:hypothetical protein
MCYQVLHWSITVCSNVITVSCPPLPGLVRTNAFMCCHVLTLCARSPQQQLTSIFNPAKHCSCDNCSHTTPTSHLPTSVRVGAKRWTAALQSEEMLKGRGRSSVMDPLLTAQTLRRGDSRSIRALRNCKLHLVNMQQYSGNVDSPDPAEGMKHVYSACICIDNVKEF